MVKCGHCNKKVNRYSLTFHYGDGHCPEWVCKDCLDMFFQEKINEVKTKMNEKTEVKTKLFSVSLDKGGSERSITIWIRDNEKNIIGHMTVLSNNKGDIWLSNDQELKTGVKK